MAPVRREREVRQRAISRASWARRLAPHEGLIPRHLHDHPVPLGPEHGRVLPLTEVTFRHIIHDE
jgi:hypothetical protein